MKSLWFKWMNWGGSNIIHTLLLIAIIGGSVMIPSWYYGWEDYDPDKCQKCRVYHCTINREERACGIGFQGGR